MTQELSEAEESFFFFAHPVPSRSGHLPHQPAVQINLRPMQVVG